MSFDYFDEPSRRARIPHGGNAPKLSLDALRERRHAFRSWTISDGRLPLPVLQGELVDLRLRSGAPVVSIPAGLVGWAHHGGPSDVVAWRFSQ